MNNMEPSPGALSGVRVLDLSHGIAGPFAARILGDFGADVIKIEKPGTGDFSRYLEPLDQSAPPPEQSLLFQYLNWNKRSVALDLGAPESQQIMQKLVSSSDIVIESFSPGTLARWKLCADRMLEWNPRAVITSITNFGQTGPYAHYRASDLVFQAMGGIMHISGRVDKEPLKHGLSQSFYCAGLNAAYISMAAYTAALSDGCGEHIDLSIHESLASELVLNMPFYAFLGAVQGRRATMQDPFLGEPIKTRDGYLSVQAGGGAPFENFADLFGKEEFRDPALANGPTREANAESIKALIEDSVKDKSAKQVFLEGSRKRLLLGVVQNAKDLLDCEHLQARNFFLDVDHPETETFRFPGELAKLSATPTTVRKRAPLLDEHRFDVLVSELGLTQEKAASLSSGQSDKEEEACQTK